MMAKSKKSRRKKSSKSEPASNHDTPVGSSEHAPADDKQFDSIESPSLEDNPQSLNSKDVTNSKGTSAKSRPSFNRKGREKRSGRWSGEDGLVIMDLEGEAAKRASIVYAAAVGMLPDKNIALLTGKWDSNDWLWERPNDGARQKERDSFQLLADLLWKVFQNRDYQGSLIIVVPDQIRSELYQWFFDPWFDLAARGQAALLESTKISNSWLHDSKISSSNLANLIVHLWYKVSQTGRAVVVCTPPAAKQFDSVTQPFFSPNYLCGLIENFDERDSGPIFSYVRTLLNRVAYRVSPTVSEKPRGKILSSDEHATLGWQNYSMLPKSAEYEDFLRQEIGSRELAGLFIKLCSEAFDRHPPPGAKFTVLPAEIQVALGALRIARRLANWTLEGDSFCCSIVLFSDSEHDELSGFYPIIEIEPDVPFTFPFIDQIRTHAEAAQGEGLFLLVNASNGKLTEIARHVDNESGERDRRHEFFGYLVSRAGLIIHLRDQGFVEVYTRGKLALWNDGFEWACYPYQKLERALDEHLTKPRLSNDDLGRKSTRDTGRQIIPHLFRAQMTLTDAIRRLLDRRASSLIVLLHEDDQAAFEELAYEELRQNIFLAGKKKTKVFVDKLDPEALAGLLAVDGAHVIDQSGRLIHLARRINATSARYSVPIDSRNDDQISKARKKIHKAQRFDEFVIWKSDVDNKTYLDIYGFVDQRKWTHSIEPFFGILESETKIKLIEPTLKKICRNLSYALLLEFKVNFKDTSELEVLDGVMSDFAESLKKQLPAIQADEKLLAGTVLSQNRVIFCRIRDPEKVDRWGYLFPLFNGKDPAPAKNFASSNRRSFDILNTGNSELDDALQRFDAELKLATCFAVEVSEPSPNTRDFWDSTNLGVGLQSVSSGEKHFWFSLDNSIKLAAESRENDLSPAVQRKFRALVRADSSESHAGTGTRAAKELNRRLTKSKVVKVSASGNLKISKPS